MKIAQLMHNASASIDLENRKKALQRRETSEAYRKSAQYQATKNPLLDALQNLLSGKAEQDLRTIDANTPTEVFEEVSLFEELKKLAQNEPVATNVQSAGTAHPIALLNKSDEIQEQLNLSEDNFSFEEQEPFTNSSTAIEVPERFLNDFSQRDAQQETVFGKNLEQHIRAKIFNKATAKYEQHVAMVRNGYRSFDEPAFSKTA